MLELDPIIEQVNTNCDIADATHAGLYSICGLALRLRDLYKWEMGLEPWIERDSSEVLDWIGKKEEKWNKVAEKKFQHIEISGHLYDPFDVDAINNLLEPHGILYGAGYAGSMKPTFFLGIIKTKKEIKGCQIFILNRELARDLFTTPAFSQQKYILIRLESAKFFLWDKIFYIKKSGRYALQFALESCGFNDTSPAKLHPYLQYIVASETNSYIYHELGEIYDKAFNQDVWKEIVSTFSHTSIEFLARGIKDILADTNDYGTLRYICKERKIASLAFYVAFLEGLREILFPEISEAFKEFMKTRNWHLIEDAITCGQNNSREYAEKMINIYQKGKKRHGNKWVEEKITKNLLAPLGL